MLSSIREEGTPDEEYGSSDCMQSLRCEAMHSNIVFGESVSELDPDSSTPEYAKITIFSADLS